jgi:hypothetical protein
MSISYSDEWYEEQKRNDEKICPEKWAEGEVDFTQMTIGEYREFCERLRKIRELSDQLHTLCRHVKLMREAIEIITKHEKSKPEKPNNWNTCLSGKERV